MILNPWNLLHAINLTGTPNAQLHSFTFVPTPSSGEILSAELSWFPVANDLIYYVYEMY